MAYASGPVINLGHGASRNVGLRFFTLGYWFCRSRGSVFHTLDFKNGFRFLRIGFWFLSLQYFRFWFSVGFGCLLLLFGFSWISAVLRHFGFSDIWIKTG